MHGLNTITRLNNTADHIEAQAILDAHAGENPNAVLERAVREHNAALALAEANTLLELAGAQPLAA